MAVVSHLFALADFDAAFRTAVRREGHKVLVAPAGQAEPHGCEGF